MKILVIKRDKIGDMLLTTPMLQHLKQSLPQAQVHVLANDYNAWVIRDNPNVDRIWIYNRVRTGKEVSLWAAIKQAFLMIRLRYERYDVAIVAGGDESKRAIARARWVAPKRVISYCARDSKLVRHVTDPLPPVPALHEADRMLAELAPLGIALPSVPIHPQYTLPPEWQRFADAWLVEHGLQRGQYVVMGLGARRAKKQPTTQQILDWSQHFKAQWGLDTVFMWTPGKSDNPLYPGDDEIAQPVLDARQPFIHPFRGALMPALGLIWGARTSIFPDSGLMHFAAASPGGVLGLFAETDVSPSPRQWGPLGEKAACMEARKDVGELSNDQVFAQVRALLDEGLRK